MHRIKEQMHLIEQHGTSEAAEAHLRELEAERRDYLRKPSQVSGVRRRVLRDQDRGVLAMITVERTPRSFLAGWSAVGASGMTLRTDPTGRVTYTNINLRDARGLDYARTLACAIEKHAAGLGTKFYVILEA